MKTTTILILGLAISLNHTASAQNYTTNIISGTSESYGVNNTGGYNYLEINSAGDLTSNYGTIGQGAAANYNSVVVTGDSSVWNINGPVTIGGRWNQLVVTNGGAVTSSGENFVGYWGAGNSSATVTGTGSVWSINGNLGIGQQSSQNQLRITDGGAVTSSGAATVGGWGAPNSSVLVSDPGSAWSLSGALTVSAAWGPSEVVITNSGVVTSGHNSALISGGVATITGAGSAWNVNGDFLIGPGTAGTGTLTVRDGGAFSTGTGRIGLNGQNQRVVITGSGSVWNLTGDLYVQGGRLTVTDGGAVHAGGGMNVYAGPDLPWLAITDGSIEIDGAAQNSGTITMIHSVGTFNGGINNTLRMSFLSNSIAAGGLVNSGSLSFLDSFTSGPVTNSGSISFSGAISNNYVQTAGNITLNGTGTITGDALINGGSFNLNGQTYSNRQMIVSGTGILTNSLAGATFKGGLSNAATVAVTADTFFNGAVTNTGAFVFRGAVSNSVANSGSVTVNNNATITGVLANSGSLTVTNGTLSLLIAPTQNGTITVASSGTLTVTPAWHNDGSLLVMGGTVNGGNLTNAIGGTIRNAGTISSLLVNLGALETLGGAGLNLNSATNGAGSTMLISNSTLTASGLLRNAGSVTLLNSAGTLQAGAVNTGTMIVSNSAQLTASAAFVNAGTVNFQHSVGTFNGTVVNSGYWITDPTTNVYESAFTNDTAGVISMAAGDVYIFRTNTTGGATVGSFVDISTNNVANDKLGGKFLFENTTLALTQNFYAAGHDLNQADATTPTNQITVASLSPLPAGYSTNFSLGTLEIANSTTARVWDAFITGGPGTNDNLRAALYVTNLLMGADSFLIISSNVSVYFLTSNTWSAANFTLLGGPVLGNQGQLHQFIIGELSVIPEPSVVLLWLAGAATVYGARRRRSRKDG